MGLLDFIRDAGDKDDDKTATTAAPAAMDELKAGNAIAGKISAAGIKIDDMRVKLTNGVVVLQGSVADQATLEKAVLIAGNTQGVSRVDEQLTVGGKPGTDFSGNVYTVKDGDTLSKIAKERFGDASRYNDIFEANQPMLKDADKIYPGQVLRMPTA